MPTGKGMFDVARLGVALVAAAVALGLPGAAQAATTSTVAGAPSASSASTSPGSTAPPGSSSTVPGPTTTVPPPPPFTLPSNFGYELLQQMQTARDALKTSEHDLGAAQKQLTKAKAHDVDVKHRVHVLSTRQRQTQRKLEATRRRLRLAIAQAYIHAGSGQLVAAISSFMNTNSAVDIGGQLHVIGTYGAMEKDALDEFVVLKRSVDQQVAEIKELSERAARTVQGATKRVNDLKTTIANAKAKILEATAGIAEFHQAATSALSPILGPSRLTAKQMADFVMANGGHPRLTVPLIDLAQIYLDEGAATEVRGDVAFAQSILETGSFAYNGSKPTENNFAGIGWCDSCAHGIDFPDARAGVRAQLQALRIYVDPAFPDASYKEKILLPGTLKLGFRGKVQTWWDLWGTWATGALYGQRVYDIYERMVEFAATDPDPNPNAPTTTTTTTTTIKHP
jgi:hypothetical protein